jgi:adenylate cyclase
MNMKTITIGRLSDNDIPIDDGLVSRHHAKIMCDDSGIFRIIDLDSKNGTYVNGRKITAEVVLSSRDTVKTGNTILPWRTYFRTDPASPPKTTDEHQSMVDTEICKNDKKETKKMTYSWEVKNN